MFLPLPPSSPSESATAPRSEPFFKQLGSPLSESPDVLFPPKSLLLLPWSCVFSSRSPNIFNCRKKIRSESLGSKFRFNFLFQLVWQWKHFINIRGMREKFENVWKQNKNLYKCDS
ncbi:hypothetical protein CsSME_00029441 [Camellia sinensis var. sinensis]